MLKSTIITYRNLKKVEQHVIDTFNELLAPKCKHYRENSFALCDFSEAETFCNIDKCPLGKEEGS